LRELIIQVKYNIANKESIVSYLSHLECGLCGKELDADRLWNLCPDCNRPLLPRYDLDQVGYAVGPEALLGRPENMWRYQEILPVKNPSFILTLGEGFTPLIHARRLGSELGFETLFIKEEGVNPTCSFKARGQSTAISRALELGVKVVSTPSAGNAAGAMSAYAALAGMEAYVYMPRDVPAPFVSECKALGAKVKLVDGLINDCGKLALEEAEKFGRFDVATLKEPYRLEGKKTMGYELAEQMDWTLPDVIIYPTGGGTGLIGMWKAFDEMETLGWVDSKRPRMVTVQSKECAPMVKAFEDGSEFAEFWEGAKTIADGLRVPGAVGDFLILRTLRESNGTAVAVTDEEMLESANAIGSTQGIFAAPEGGAALAAFHHLRKDGWIKDNDKVVLFNTGSGHKYSHLWQ
jgi:threonine synthase